MNRSIKVIEKFYRANARMCMLLKLFNGGKKVLNLILQKMKE